LLAGQNKAVHHKPLQCTAVDILTLHNDCPESELKWLLTNLMSFFEQTVPGVQICTAVVVQMMADFGFLHPV
jgi:hypothetical protein